MRRNEQKQTPLLRPGLFNRLLKSDRRDPSRSFEVGFPTNPRLPWIAAGILAKNLAYAVTPVDIVALGVKQPGVRQNMLPIIKRDGFRPFRPLGNHGVTRCWGRAGVQRSDRSRIIGKRVGCRLVAQ
jgi:hypothetical protein